MPYLLGASTPVTTVTTPSSASARRESMCLMRACGYGECNILPISMPGTLRSSVYLPWPVVLPAESISAIGLPMMEKSLLATFLTTPEMVNFFQTNLLHSLIELNCSNKSVIDDGSLQLHRLARQR